MKPLVLLILLLAGCAVNEPEPAREMTFRFKLVTDADERATVGPARSMILLGLIAVAGLVGWGLLSKDQHSESPAPGIPADRLFAEPKPQPLHSKSGVTTVILDGSGTANAGGKLNPAIPITIAVELEKRGFKFLCVFDDVDCLRTKANPGAPAVDAIASLISERGDIFKWIPGGLRRSAQRAYKGQKVTVVRWKQELCPKLAGSKTISFVELSASGGQIRCALLGPNPVPVMGLREALAALGVNKKAGHKRPKHHQVNGRSRPFANKG